VFAKAKGSAVTIWNKSSYDEKKSLGSGFAVGDGSLVVTNHHVVEGAGRVDLKTSNGTVIKDAQVVLQDKEHDLALLRIPYSLASLELEGEEIRVGQEVVVIGSPLGLEHTVSTGVVSGKRKTKEDLKLVQISAPISPGSSGGPVLNAQGRVIGVATLASVFIAQNLNFAVYVEHVQALLDRQAGKAAESPAASGGLDVRKAADGSITIIQERPKK
jgi:S1-C subfamily serine protease